MGMLAVEKRNLAETCIVLSINRDFEQAARLRQQEYALNPPGSIGTDWGNWKNIWECDSQYVTFMLQEDFSDCENTDEKIRFLQAGIFVDYLFDFRDCWGIKRQAELNKEPFSSIFLEKYLIKENWQFISENRELIYTSTKKQNISARMYYEGIRAKGLPDSAHPKIYKPGEYYLGFPPGTPQKIIDGRRKWLEMYDLFFKMSLSNLEKFPKTFQTFEKHALSNSAKYQAWMRQYSDLIQK